MSGALNAVTSGELKPSEAIVNYGVSRQTLRDRLSGWVICGTNPRPKPYLMKNEEEILTDHLILIILIFVKNGKKGHAKGHFPLMGFSGTFDML